MMYGTDYLHAITYKKIQGLQDSKNEISIVFELKYLECNQLTYNKWKTNKFISTIK